MYSILIDVTSSHKLQLSHNLRRWHGTIDTTLYYENLSQELLEWSDILGVSWTQNKTNNPLAGYTQIVYGDGTKLIGYSAVGVGHTVPVQETIDLAWFGITGGTTTGTTTTSKTATSTSTSPPVTSTASSGSVPEWGQW
jgi:acetylxylan esterase